MTTKKKPKDAKVTWSHGNKLFERLGVSQTRLLMEKAFPNAKIVPQGSAKFLMNCPTPGHPDANPSFLVDCQQGYAKCKASGCGYFTRNVLQLLQDCKGWTFKEGVSQVQAITGLRIATEKVEKELDELDIHQQAYRLLFKVCNDHLRKCVTPPPGDEEYSAIRLRAVQPTLDWLFKTRGHLPQHVSELPYGVFPPHHQVLAQANRLLEDQATKQLADAPVGSPVALTPARREKILARLEELTKAADGAWVHAVTFHTGYALTTPGRMRLRRPVNDKNDNLLTLPGFSDDDPMGFFGLYTPSLSSFRSDELESFQFLLVEGENDAITLQEHLLENGKTGVYVLASCGGHNASTDLLAQAGVQRAYFVGDDPDPEYGKGDEWVHQRLQTTLELDARVFVRWGELGKGDPAVKDPDDAVHVHGFRHVYDVLVRDAQTNFIASDLWAFERAVAATASIPDDETNERLQKAAHFGQCVRPPALLAKYLDRIATHLDIAVGPLRAEVIKAKDTELGFIARIAETIRHEFHVLHKEDNARGGTLTLYHKRTRRQIEFYMTDGEAMMAQFANVFGEMYTFFRDHIGLPPSYGDANTEDLPNVPMVRDRQKDIQAYLKIAMQHIYMGVPGKSECTLLRTGTHWVQSTEDDTEKVLYIVNGTKVFKGKWPEGDAAMTWEQLDGPSDGKYIFDITAPAWSKELNSVQDLLWGNGVTLDDLKGIAKDVYKLFNSCWRLVYQELDAKFLAYHLLAMAAHVAFKTKVIVAFLGKSSTGKSTAMSVFDGGQYEHLRLLEASVSKANYSVASIYQTWDASSLAMGLQEFEDEGDGRSHKGQVVENLSELLRQIIFDTGVTVSRGATDGKVKNYHLHTNVFLTAILNARKPQDENRRFAVETLKLEKEAVKDPAVAVFELFSPERLQEMRRMLTLGLHKHIPMLARHHDKVYLEMNQRPMASFPVPSRFLRHFVPMSSMMELLGDDWGTLVGQISESRQERLQAIAEDNNSANLYSRIMHNPSINVGQGGRAAVLTLLSSEETWRMVNTSGCGFFYDDTTKMGVVDWVAVTGPGGLLDRSPELARGSTPRNLKYVLDQHPRAIKSREYADKGVYEMLKRNKVVAAQHEISALDLTDIVAPLREAQKNIPKAAPELEIIPGGKASNNL